jgi:hypothetical protein
MGDDAHRGPQRTGSSPDRVAKSRDVVGLQKEGGSGVANETINYSIDSGRERGRWAAAQSKGGELGGAWVCDGIGWL